MKKLLLIIFFLNTINSFAQITANTVERKGFVIGIGLRGGVVSITDSNQEIPFEEAQGGFSLPNLKIGFMLNERTALLATFPGMIYEYQGKDRSFEAFVPTVQYWMNDKLWINGGIGLGMDFPAFYEVKKVDDEQWNWGCAVSTGIGYEIVQKQKFTIDLQSNLLLGRTFLPNDLHRDGVVFSVGVGFNWY